MMNLFWYICLAVTGVGMLIFTWFKKRNFADLVTFFLSVCFFIFLCEYFVLIIFQAYVYKPGILADSFADSVAGHLISNMFVWGGSAVLIAAFALRYRWIFLFSIAFMLIEEFFNKLGIYEQNWWKTYFTGIGAFLCLSLMKVWYAKLRENRHALLRNATLLLAAGFVITIPVTMLTLLEKLYFVPGWVENKYRDDFMFSYIYHSCMAVIFVFFLCIHQKPVWKAAPAAVILLSDFILVSMNVLIFINGWNFLLLTIVRIVTYVIFILLAKYSLKGSKIIAPL
ncbi:hypothetical protein ACFOLF_04955 [Paenibacillus sepulcri]|uniref:Uncharacterized protein n=1 Tax=Paenibacillus sepulcri TaxID=359917 RepID=A0ABS7C7H2_9BACL|nr:hypothetical protein [Paenibacillus sepulcri]